LTSSLSTTTKSSSASSIFCFFVDGCSVSSTSLGSSVGASGSCERISLGSVDVSCSFAGLSSASTGGKKVLYA
jgi:hypothetical protein